QGCRSSQVGNQPLKLGGFKGELRHPDAALWPHLSAPPTLRRAKPAPSPSPQTSLTPSVPLPRGAPTGGSCFGNPPSPAMVLETHLSPWLAGTGACSCPELPHASPGHI
ncbi:unnamed protein product, partial [Bubo scandiacus]